MNKYEIIIYWSETDNAYIAGKAGICLAAKDRRFRIGRCQLPPALP
jgi:hypothetical protein